MEKYHLFVLVLELSDTPPEAELENLKMIPRGQRYMTNPPAHPKTSPYCEQKKMHKPSSGATVWRMRG